LGAGARAAKYGGVVRVPQGGGDLKTPPVELAYFDPYDKRYQIARAEPIKLSVVGEVAGGGSAATTENVLAPAIRNLRNAKTIHSRIGAVLYKSSLFVALLAVPVGLYVILLVLDKIRQ